MDIPSSRADPVMVEPGYRVIEYTAVRFSGTGSGSGSRAPTVACSDCEPPMTLAIDKESEILLAGVRRELRAVPEHTMLYGTLVFDPARRRMVRFILISE